MDHLLAIGHLRPSSIFNCRDGPARAQIATGLAGRGRGNQKARAEPRAQAAGATASKTTKQQTPTARMCLQKEKKRKGQSDHVVALAEPKQQSKGGAGEQNKREPEGMGNVGGALGVSGLIPAISILSARCAAWVQGEFQPGESPDQSVQAAMDGPCGWRKRG